MHKEQVGFAVDHSQSLQPGFFPEDLGRNLDGLALGDTEWLVLDILRRNFQLPLTVEELVRQGLAPDFTNMELKNLQVAVCRIRPKLPESLSLYTLRGDGKYMLDWRRPVGSWFLPRHREHVIERMSEDVMSQELVPFLRYSNNHYVCSPQQLLPRLTSTEYEIISRLVNAYPGPMEFQEMEHLRRFDEGRGSDFETLQVYICRARQKLADYDHGDARIVPESGIGYRLSFDDSPSQA